MDRPTGEDKNLDMPIWGAEAIGKEIGKTKREAFYGLERGHIPGKKVGGQWISTPRALRKRFHVEA